MLSNTIKGLLGLPQEIIVHKDTLTIRLADGKWSRQYADGSWRVYGKEEQEIIWKWFKLPLPERENAAGSFWSDLLEEFKEKGVTC